MGYGTPDHGQVAVSVDLPAAANLTSLAGASEAPWVERTLAALSEATPYWLGDPADRASALLMALASSLDDLPEAVLETARVQLSVSHLASACEAALWIARNDVIR